MRIIKKHPLLKMVNSYLIDSPQPSNLSYMWNFGSLLAMCLVIQIATGVTLGMHYTPNVNEAFDSIEHIMRDVNNGWLIRYLHSNTASAFFFLVYLHIGRGLYYGSYRTPRTLVWTIGTIILILMIATAFLGYVLPYGQMSLWGATVITNLMSAIPWVGQDIVEFIWGGFSVNNATLNRFFALHFVLPFVLAALALMHLIALHDSSGSGNPLGISGNYDRLPFWPYFIFKDLVTIFLFILVLSIFVFFMPNVLGDSENYVMANPMQTPPAIVPEWYLLPFYAILRSIPNKLLGVIAMFSALLALLVMPFSDLSKIRGIQFRPLSKIIFFIFIANFLILMQLGAKHVESPFIEFGQISTALYFAYFLILVPAVTLLENSLVDLSTTPIKATEELKINGSPIQSGMYIYLSVGACFLPLNFDVLTFNEILNTGIDLLENSMKLINNTELNIDFKNLLHLNNTIEVPEWKPSFSNNDFNSILNNGSTKINNDFINWSKPNPRFIMSHADQCKLLISLISNFQIETYNYLFEIFRNLLSDINNVGVSSISYLSDIINVGANNLDYLSNIIPDNTDLIVNLQTGEYFNPPVPFDDFWEQIDIDEMGPIIDETQWINSIPNRVVNIFYNDIGNPIIQDNINQITGINYNLVFNVWFSIREDPGSIPFDIIQRIPSILVHNPRLSTFIIGWTAILQGYIDDFDQLSGEPGFIDNMRVLRAAINHLILIYQEFDPFFEAPELIGWIW